MGLSRFPCAHCSGLTLVLPLGIAMGWPKHIDRPTKTVPRGRTDTGQPIGWRQSSIGSVPNSGLTAEAGLAARRRD